MVFNLKFREIVHKTLFFNLHRSLTQTDVIKPAPTDVAQIFVSPDKNYFTEHICSARGCDSAADQQVSSTNIRSRGELGPLGNNRYPASGANLLGNVSSPLLIRIFLIEPYYNNLDLFVSTTKPQITSED